MLAKLKDKETWRQYFGSLKFALYCTTHPLDGYWDLTHEKRGTIAAANTILVLTLITRILKDRRSTRLNSSHYQQSRMPSSA